MCTLWGWGAGLQSVYRIRPGQKMRGALTVSPTSTKVDGIVGTHLTHWQGNG